ncbi:piggyBac transposable element-derived protein 4-like [Xyrichtys novacula]|uniref:PiggyBac transposable element-derived protein 4-like n=1 Tax=Xyrichtys novacula TaxID=13765 RepID=A0AAV1GBE0_XYRNO|nr:piggyBac transposable element-derived protein 4-like [Xyrichtys novacula]
MEDAFDPENQENSDEDEDDEEMEVEGGVPKAGMISKNGLTWSRTAEETLRYLPPAIPHPGITRHAAARIKVLDDTLWFFLTEEIIQILVLETNREGRLNDENWRITDVTEIRAFIGLLSLAGLHRARHEATVNLWGEDTGRPIFRATMSRKRFDELCINLRFDNRETRRPHDKFAPIRNLWQRWVDRLHMGHNLGENICIDEQLVSFHGHWSFKQYMPQKPAKYGLKLWVLCNVNTSYAWKMIPYLGKEASAAHRRQEGKEVVLELTEGLSGHTITVDNFFTSYDLAMQLQRRKLALVGTIRRNKPEIPSQLTNTRG